MLAGLGQHLPCFNRHHQAVAFLTGVPVIPRLRLDAAFNVNQVTLAGGIDELLRLVVPQFELEAVRLLPVITFLAWLIDQQPGVAAAGAGLKAAQFRIGAKATDEPPLVALNELRKKFVHWG